MIDAKNVTVHLDYCMLKFGNIFNAKRLVFRPFHLEGHKRGSMTVSF